MEKIMSNNKQWLANYYHRLGTWYKKRSEDMKTAGVPPLYEDLEVKHYTLVDHIKHMGVKTSAEVYGVSTASVKAWRYGYRLPSPAQAKKMIKASNGKLDYESIFGCPSDID